MKRSPSVSNQGIQGSVTADVLAVGYKARAVKTTISETDRAQLEELHCQLEDAIAVLRTDPETKKVMQKEAAALKELTTRENPDRAKIGGALSILVEKVKLLGALTSSVATLLSPLEKIAGLFHLSLQTFGM